MPDSSRKAASSPVNGHATPGTQAPRNSFASSRRQLSGFLPGTNRDLGALVRDSRRSLDASGRSLPGAQAGSKGMVLPFAPLNLSFHHLSYYVDLPKVPPAHHANTGHLLLADLPLPPLPSLPSQILTRASPSEASCRLCGTDLCLAGK